MSKLKHTPEGLVIRESSPIAIDPESPMGRVLRTAPHDCTNPTCEGARNKRKLEALEESVKLQSHYAKLLNEYDGGSRLTFDSADAWVERLDASRPRRSRRRWTMADRCIGVPISSINEVPHDCPKGTCPGAVNKRKLEALDGYKTAYSLLLRWYEDKGDRRTVYWPEVKAAFARAEAAEKGS